ncbi:hypothetical protein M3Y94_00612700 [Aphelenchoides besseyi]|nr:hypothetical protein M3Y94_00612700 [Aphelenchoides besseyi]
MSSHSFRYLFQTLLLIPLTSATRFVLANGMIVYGVSAATVTASTSTDCAYQTLEADGVGFVWDGSSQCEVYTTITGYSLTSTSTDQYYIKNDDYTQNTCISSDGLVEAIHKLVYNGNDCPDAFTYNPTEQVCQSTMSQTDCNKYNATWAYQYMPTSSNPCVLYPSFQTTYLDAYYCDNYFAQIQIFMGSAYCYANVAVTSAMAGDVTTISSDDCYEVFDVNSHILKVGSETEVDWLYAMFGNVMIGAYKRGFFNFPNSYYFYDNSSASSFVTGTLSGSGGFLYTDGTQVTSSTVMPNSILMCKSAAVQATC